MSEAKGFVVPRLIDGLVEEGRRGDIGNHLSGGDDEAKRRRAKPPSPNQIANFRERISKSCSRCSGWIQTTPRPLGLGERGRIDGAEIWRLW